MANSTITTVQFLYKRVIEETIKSSRETFLNEGIEDSVLQELKKLWESKVQASSAVDTAANPADYVTHSQVYKYNSGFKTQSGNLGFVTAMGSRNPQTLLPRQQQPIAARPSNMGNQAGSSASAPFLPSVPFPSLSGVTTATKEEFNKASDSIQVDGATHIPTGAHISTDSDEECTVRNVPASNTKKKKKRRVRKAVLPDLSGAEAAPQLQRTLRKRGGRGVPIVLQVDGMDSDDDAGEFVDSEESEDDDEEDEDDDTDEDIDVGGDRPGGLDSGIGGVDIPIEEEDPLNSEDDESDEDGEEHLKTDNVIVCLFDKVTRSKNKWKLYLKDGVMHISGKDHVFQKAVGDGEF